MNPTFNTVVNRKGPKREIDEEEIHEELIAAYNIIIQLICMVNKSNKKHLLDELCKPGAYCHNKKHLALCNYACLKADSTPLQDRAAQLFDAIGE